MLTAFPLEIIDRILDYLHKDRRSLKNASLVCKNWLPTSRFHLFHHIVIYEDNIADLIVTIRSPLCTIHSTIPWITFNSLSSNDPNIKAAVPLLNIAEGLTLINFCWDGSNAQAITTLLPNLRHLVLQDTQFDTYNSLATCISSCSNLESLAVDLDASGRRHLHFKLPIAMITTAPPPCRRIYIDYPIRLIIAWFLQHPHSYSRLSTLELSSVMSSEHPAIKQFIHVLGDSLEVLRIDCGILSSQSHFHILTRTNL